jgi:hypothetical protein
MPWSEADARGWVKGATDKQATVGARVANSVLTRCLADGGKEGECAGSAIRQAKSMMAKMKEAGPLAEELAAALILGSKEEPMTRGRRTPLSEVALANGQTVQDFLDKIAAAAKLIGNPTNAENVWVYASDIYETTVVFQVSGSGIGEPRFYEADYSVDADGSVVLADPREVKRTVVYKPVEAGVPEAEEEAIETAEEALRGSDRRTVFVEMSGHLVAREGG